MTNEEILKKADEEKIAYIQMIQDYKPKDGKKLWKIMKHSACTCTKEDSGCYRCHYQEYIKLAKAICKADILEMRK